MKIKISNLNNAIDKFSGRELDLYLYLIKRQNTIGLSENVYYLDAMKDLYMPKSTFYSALRALMDMGFVRLQDSNTSKGFDLFVVDNIFTGKADFKEGYLNINLDFILSKRFILLGVNIKKFLLRMLSLQAGTKDVKLLKDTLVRYKVNRLLKELEELFIITPVEGGYIFRIRSFIMNSKVESDSYILFKNKVIKFCRNFNITYTAKTLRDTSNSIRNQIVTNHKGARVQKALDAIRRIGCLQPKLINHICGSGAL